MAHSCLSHPDKAVSEKNWQALKNNAPVRIQWDPERDLLSRPLQYRAIQVGLSKEAVELYLRTWIHRIIDVTDVAHTIHNLVSRNQLDEARAMLPVEQAYPLSKAIEAQLEIRQPEDQQFF